MKEGINQHDAEGRHHGVWGVYCPNGTLWLRAHYHHGKQHGVWEGYYSNGTLQWRAHYHHGVRKGLAMWRDTQGGIASKKYHLVIR